MRLRFQYLGEDDTEFKDCQWIFLIHLYLLSGPKKEIRVEISFYHQGHNHALATVSSQRKVRHRRIIA